MFGRIYAGELKKILRPKSMIVLAAILVLVLVAYAVIYNFLGSITQSITDNPELEEMGVSLSDLIPSENSMTEEYVAGQIEYYKMSIEELENEYKNEKYGYNAYPSLFSAKAHLAAFEYVRDHNLYGADTRFLGINYSIGTSTLTADGFVSDYMGVVASVMAIYAIVIGAGMLADEYKNGTIKLLLTRPITKNQLITAKFLAALTVTIGISSLFILIGYIYGLIAFPSEATKSIYLVFNAKNVFQTTVGGCLFGSYVLNMLKCAVMCLIAYFLGTLARKKTVGIIITIIIHLGIISSILGMLPVQIGLLVPNMSLMKYFEPNSSVPIYGNFFISLAVYIVYVAAVTFGLYFSVNKRDVI